MHKTHTIIDKFWTSHEYITSDWQVMEKINNSWTTLEQVISKRPVINKSGKSYEVSQFVNEFSFFFIAEMDMTYGIGFTTPVQGKTLN